MVPRHIGGISWWAFCPAALLVAGTAWAQPGAPAEPAGESAGEPQPEAWVPSGTPSQSVPAEPTPPAPCKASAQCRRAGLCTAHEGQCYAASDDDCRRSEYCAQGLCTADQGRCVIGNTADCQRSRGCFEEGNCSLLGDRCAPASDRDCRDATACRVFHSCAARAGRCVLLPPRARTSSTGDTATKLRSELVRNAGIGLTIAGTLLGVGGVAMLASGDTAILGAAVAPVGGALIITGIPLWVIGASEIPELTEPESEAAIIGGTILAGLGVAGTGVSGAVAIAGSKAALLPLGLGIAAVGGGVALATYGAEEVVLGQTSTLPQVRIGPGSFDLRWSF